MLSKGIMKRKVWRICILMLGCEGFKLFPIYYKSLMMCDKLRYYYKRKSD